MEALKRAIKKAGGQAKLARAVGGKDKKASLVHNWIKRGFVPAEWCPAIERETGVRCEELRSDVDWAVLRKK